jgi:raffinose/stachyose/melibiose transport system substrate-binding protein
MFKRGVLGLLTAALCCGAVLTTHAADITVRLLHPDNDPKVASFFNESARRFEAQRPGVKISMQYLEGESYKKKLTTLLQSPDKPHIIYSWGGGVMRDQIKAGVIQDLTADMKSGSPAPWQARFLPSALRAYSVDGKVWGVPFQATQVGIWFNKDLLAKAGVDANAIKTWDDLLAATAKLKAAGITPFSVGGADKWPLHYFWAMLAMRLGGADALAIAQRGEAKGFEGETFVRAAEMFKQLADLKPFQPGFQGASFFQSVGAFGDGKAAMMLMVDNVPNAMPPNSADKRGVPLDKLGWMPFPLVKGGKGSLGDTMGGMNGFLVTQGAPKEAVDFLRYFSEAQNQRLAAEAGAFVPVVVGTQDALKDSFMRLHAATLTRSSRHQLYFDQELGASAGAVIKDLSVDLATGRQTPAAAAAALQRAWKPR